MTRKRPYLLTTSLRLLAGGALLLGPSIQAETGAPTNFDQGSADVGVSVSGSEHVVNVDADVANSCSSDSTCSSASASASLDPPTVRIPCPTTSSTNSSASMVEDEFMALGTTQLLGLGYDASKIRPKVLSQLLELNCRQNVELHVLSRFGNEETTKSFQEAQQRCYGGDSSQQQQQQQQPHTFTSSPQCASFHFDPDPPSARAIQNRVDRIAYLRDYQRDRAYFLHQESNSESDINPNAFLQNQAVILVDLDMHYIPTNNEILGEVQRIQEDDTWDVICAAGLMHHPFGYYDIFATVLEDSTFVYPLAGRLDSTPMKTENVHMIRSDPLYGEITQEGLFHHFKQQASEHPDGVVPVQSCFGGLAVYRGSTFFTPGCRYSAPTTTSDDARSRFESFANLEDGTPCEHIIFHDCLRKSSGPTSTPQTKIAIQPSLNTWWDNPVQLGSYLRPGGKVSTGLVETDGLVRSSRRPDEALRLENGDYQLIISDKGGLIIQQQQQIPVWELEVNSTATAEWDYAFLTLAKDGELILAHQYNEQSCLDCFQNGSGPKSAEKACQPCRKAVWSSGKRLMSGYTTNSFLHLGRDGILRVVDIRRDEILWQSHTSDSSSLSYGLEQIIAEIRPPVERQCIPSGTDKEINAALSGDFAEAILCPGSVFLLKDTIKFTSSNQALYTEGYPTGHDRAILRLVDKSAVVAINMLNMDHAQLKNVFIDGNREGLKQARGRKYLNALIQAGGRSQGQIISDIEASDTRSWSILHLAEGDDEESCGGALVEQNRLGPAGYHRSGSWADGISTACKQSLVRNNTIVDATDVALVLFGGPGSIIEDNHIIARTRIASAGITLVDFGPYDGNFSGSIVRRNTIDARNATIGVGVAMGPRTWQCMNPQDLVNVTLWNATVTENTLRGDHMQYGYAVDGVKNWTVTGNIDDAKHLQGAEELPNDCRTEDSYLSPPAGFQINRNTSSGVFQDEFEDANIEFLIANVIGMRATKCIPSGDQDSINHELTGAFAKAVLCQGAVFNLTAPIIFTAPHQGIFTEGKPEDGKKARLQVVDPSVSVAVRMLNENYALLSHVVIDGNRPLLGPADGSNYDDALIQAGGETKGQVIRSVDISNTRSWASLHLAEGDAANRCGGALIENNVIGPSGYYMPTEWAVGISMACRDSWIKNNSIQDATDVGLSIFGAPGSIVEGNHILADSAPLRAAISLVDYAPYDGDYVGSVIQNNTVTAINQPMMIGIAMGPRAWEKVDSVDMGPRRIFGGQVLANHLQGQFSLYGLYAAGVQNWTVSDNVLTTSITEDGMLSNSSAFVVDPCISSGDFQSEFETALSVVSNAAGNHPCLTVDDSGDLATGDETPSADLAEEPNDSEPVVEQKATQIPYRVYKRRTLDFPCYRPGQQTTRGFFYAKIPRTGSTTMAGVARRIAAHQGMKKGGNCNLRVGHGSPLKKFKYGNRDAEKSFLWTFVREPAGRALSSFFYHKVSKNGWESSDKMFLKWADKYESNYQTNFLTLTEDGPSVEEILASYDFIGVTERMDESLVALMMIMNLDFSDILYLSSKRNGFAFTSDADGNLKCIEVAPKRKSKAMESYFKSTHWTETNKEDILLFKAANDSLDKTIESLGGAEFKDNLVKYRRLLRVAVAGCSDSAVFPCETLGAPNVTSSCYARDEGCGYECLDRIGQGEGMPSRNLENEGSPSATVSEAEGEARVVLLMSFPNSGTSYTQRVAATVSEISTATNYGAESKGEMESIYRGQKSGPFWVPSAFDRPDDELILTKTHCGGYCIACPSRDYLLTTDKFISSCLSYNRGQTSEPYDMEYSLDLVSKSVHLFRDPFDNIVSRFNHERKNRFAREGITKYGDGPEDFRVFCREYVDARSFKKGFVPPVDESMWKTLVTVPCHTDFLRYINWHNHASEMIQQTSLPALVLHYEDYGTHWNQTVTKLLDFLEQPPEGTDPATFKTGKTYRHYYFEHEIAAIRACFEKIASEATWPSMSRYFPEHAESHDTGSMESSSETKHDRSESVIVSQPSDTDGPNIVWLMSFPNSGTTYTQFAAASVSAIGTATNYGPETKGELASIYEGENMGPYWVPSTYERPSEGYILTKNHCGGRCVRCPPKKSLVSYEEFLGDCLRYTKLVDSGKRQHAYPIELVHKAVHLLRDPFDNIVSRYHHERKNKFSSVELQFYANSPAGFRSFCRDYVDVWSFKKGFVPPVDQDTWNTLVTVPCHTDFLRYINWHNHASDVIQQNSIPTLILHYEDYGTRWNQTVTKLLDFLEQSPEGTDPTAFKKGKAYRHYYFEHEIAAIRASFEKMASEATWSKIGHYLQDESDPTTVSDATISSDSPTKSPENSTLVSREPCDFDALRSAFSPRPEPNKDGTCWNTDDYTILIPVEAIVNRNETEHVAWSGEGIVRVATISLPDGSTCNALINTNYCDRDESESSWTDCMAEGAKTTVHSVEASRAASMSALLFRSARKEGVELGGFLPTWGGLVGKSELQSTELQPRVGSLMPMMPPETEYDSFDAVLEGRSITKFADDPVDNAKLWLPLAETLSFAEGLGLYFQDISGRTIGIMSSETGQVAVIQNTTYLTKLESVGCEDQNRDACNFCDDSNNFQAKQRPAFSDEMVVQKDCERFLHLVFLALKQGRSSRRPEDERIARILFEALDGIKYERGKCTMANVASTLQLFVRKFDATESTPVTSAPVVTEYDNAPPCSYEVLRNAFQQHEDLTTSTNSTCWSLKEEILRVPTSAITNPDGLQLLGRGSQGVVHKATIRLSDSQFCSVAIKGDKCRNVQTNEKFVSCISSNAVRMETAQSVVDEEYMGALLFHAAAKAGEDLPGFLPTWGFIHDDKETENLNRGRADRALIMPIVDFESLDSILSGRRKDDILPNPAKMAELMLPVLKTLTFVENLGMSFQDVHKKNIGVISHSGSSSAFVFDSTHLTFLETDRCDAAGNPAACEFCIEPEFMKKKRNPSFTQEMIRLKDCKNFVNTFLFYFEKTDRVEEPLWKTLDSIMYSFEDCTLSNVRIALEGYLEQRRKRTIDSIQPTGKDRIARLPFIFEIADFDIIANETKSLELLAWERTSNWKRSSSRTGIDVALDFDEREQDAVLFDPKGLKATIGDLLEGSDRTQCPGNVTNESGDFQWIVQPTESYPGNGYIGSHSVYVESNGTVTVALDTCKIDGSQNKYFTLIQAENGCTKEECNFRIVHEDMFSPPFPCALNQSHASFGCPCALESPAVWFDKPTNKWRMLMNQFRSHDVAGQCVYNSLAQENSGGYAESQSEYIAGKWNYDFFQSAYGDEIRHSEEEGWRLLEYKHLVSRGRPMVVLGESGGLDGGFLFNDVCEWDGYEHITNYTKEMLCGKRMFGVARSTSTTRQLASGTIYIQYHAETGNKTYPEANGPRGKARAQHWKSQFNDEIYKAPKSIITPMVEDYKKRRGQRLIDSVTPLANHLGVNVSIGPTLVDSPRWTADPATEVALMALDSLNEGTVVVSYWSFTWELCEKIGTKCEEFDEPGQFHAIHLVDGKVVSIENKLFDNFGDDVFWNQLNETSRNNWATLGWDEESWNDAEKPKKRSWENLSLEQQSAASVLGYNETTWNAHCTYMQILVPEELKYCNI